MRPRIALLASAMFASCRSPGSVPVPEARAGQADASDLTGTAVLELFTSEGCSSCPPADAVLADVARANERSLYALGFHVDYWDDLGWPDRFAAPVNTARQRAYARAFGSGSLYTPQAIVGGTEQFNGSDRDRADAAIGRALSRPTALHLAVRARRRDAGTFVVDYDAPGAPSGCVLDVAVVERSTSTVVRAGENAGKTLRHANVVRSFTVTPLTSPTGSLIVAAPPSLRSEDGEVIAYAQQSVGGAHGLPILGAARAPLPR
jgi:hypothetical protein